MQLALRRHHGDLRMAYQAVGRALLLCGGTAIAGFGSLAWSSNAGMASLGQVCAVGIASNMIISVYLLPVWWALTARLGGSAAAGAPPSEPSSLYSAEVWRLGCGLVRMVPLKLCRALSRGLVEMYWHLAVHRRNVVIENLLPGAGNDRTAAKKTAKRLFQQFGIKVIDLWRYEAGLPIDDLLGDSTGWEHFQKAKEQNRGVLFLTPHLGNWEFGGPWLTRRGYPLQVITLAEPGEDFTRLRQASRARWKIETLVIGNDPFAFVEVIRRLEAGATVALLVDRPPPPTAVIVNLFGRTFSASVAAAELARASGCVLLPVYLPRGKDAYAAHVLPPIEYDRAALRDREARRKLTQEILRAFEPIIGQHLDQWYHFVPVWPKANE
jgi:KDO2-lipid IV(A) lauroyltransferase